MTFAQDIKQLGKFLKEQGFITVPLNHGKYRSWVKELDSENLVYLYVYINQHRQGNQIGHLIVSPPRGNDDLWERDPLAVGIALAEEWQDENGSFNGYFDDYIHRLNNLLPSTVGLKDAVIREMQNPSNISTSDSQVRELGLRQLIRINAFRLLQQESGFAELCQASKEAWFKQKNIYRLDTALGEKCFAPYSNEITFRYIEDCTWDLSKTLATYSAFR